MDVPATNVEVLSCDVRHNMYVYKQSGDEEPADPFEGQLELIEAIPTRDQKILQIADDVVAYQFFTSTAIRYRVNGLIFDLSDQDEKGDVENRQHETCWYIPGGKLVEKGDLPEDLERYADENCDDGTQFVQTRLDTYLTFSKREKYEIV